MWSLLRKLLGFGEHPILAGVSFWLLAQWLDLISTEFAMAYVPGSYEGNIQMQNPINGKLLLGTAIVIKLFSLFAWLFPMAGFIYWGTNSKKMAAIPFYVAAFLVYGAAMSNIVTIIEVLLRR